ncbi:flagellar export chaperone FliS [bacterium]|jgi:flagellar protein FliS|nr:flagellar export chaperone FliS [bacterium]
MMSPAQSYARAYQSQSILTASPGQLVLLLFDGALRFMNQARASFAEPEGSPKRLETINTSILRAQAILNELQANLNHEAGGDISKNLDRLYDYYNRRLLEANMRKQEAPLIEVEALVRTLRDGWAEMLRSSEVKVA